MTMHIDQNTQLMQDLRLLGMAQDYIHQKELVSNGELPFEVRVAMMLDAEKSLRGKRKYDRNLKQSKIKYPHASLETMDWSPSRGVDKVQILNLASCEFVDRALFVLILGATGTGKTHVACALALQALKHGYRAMQVRLNRLVEDLRLAEADGSLPRFRNKLLKLDLLIIDDWALSPITSREARNLFEVIEDLMGQTAIIITSQLPVTEWHDWLGNSNTADGMVDRIVNHSYRIELRGESQRRRYSPISQEGTKL